MMLKGKAVSRKKLVGNITSAAYSIFRFALLIAIGYIVIYPVIYMLSSSIKTPIKTFNMSPPPPNSNPQATLKLGSSNKTTTKKIGKATKASPIYT